MTTRARLHISGRVQGVFFRARTREKAQALGLTGWVRNLPDGRVEAVVEGGEAAVDALIAWAKIGPPAARVHDVAVSREPPTGQFAGFSIRN